jgi:hypothetical protein
MWNTVFVTVHAVAAVAAFAAGLLALRTGRSLAVYRLAVAVMATALVPAVLVDWATTDLPARVAFAGLIGLAAVMVVRAELAGRRPPRVTGGPTPAYVDHIGFTLISLAVGFAVVSGIRLGAPSWVVAALGVGIVLAGRSTLGRFGRRAPLAAAAGWTGGVAAHTGPGFAAGGDGGSLER